MYSFQLVGGRHIGLLDEVLHVLGRLFWCDSVLWADVML